MANNKEIKILKITSKNIESKDIPEDINFIIFNKKYPKFSKFNKKIDNLPQKLIHLFLKSLFNQKVDNLPKNLTHLSFGDYFNQKINHLPKNLIHLYFTFNSCFNQKIDNLPKNNFFRTRWYLTKIN